MRDTARATGQVSGTKIAMPMPKAETLTVLTTGSIITSYNRFAERLEDRRNVIRQVQRGEDRCSEAIRPRTWPSGGYRRTQLRHAPGRGRNSRITCGSSASSNCRDNCPAEGRVPGPPPDNSARFASSPRGNLSATARSSGPTPCRRRPSIVESVFVQSLPGCVSSNGRLPVSSSHSMTPNE